MERIQLSSIRRSQYRIQYPQAASSIADIIASVIPTDKQTELLSRLSPIAIVSNLSLHVNTISQTLQRMELSSRLSPIAIVSNLSVYDNTMIQTHQQIESLSRLTQIASVTTVSYPALKAITRGYAH